MKKLLLFSVILLLVSACSKDDGESSGELSIVGHWVSMSSHTVYTDLTTKESYEHDTSPDESLSLKFYEDGTFLKGTNATGTYKRLGNEVDVYLSYYINTYDREGNSVRKLIENSESYIIKDLSSDKITISTSVRVIGENGIDEINKTYAMRKMN